MYAAAVLEPCATRADSGTKTARVCSAAIASIRRHASYGAADAPRQLQVLGHCAPHVLSSGSQGPRDHTLSSTG